MQNPHEAPCLFVACTDFLAKRLYDVLVAGVDFLAKRLDDALVASTDIRAKRLQNALVTLAGFVARCGKLSAHFAAEFDDLHFERGDAIG